MKSFTGNKYHFTKEQIKEMKRLYVEEKKTLVEVGRVFNVSYQVVGRRLRKERVVIREQNVFHFSNKSMSNLRKAEFKPNKEGSQCIKCDKSLTGKDPAFVCKSCQLIEWEKDGAI